MKVKELLEARKFDAYEKWLMGMDWLKSDPHNQNMMSPGEFADDYSKRHNLNRNEVFSYMMKWDEDPEKMNKAQYEEHRKEIIEYLLRLFKAAHHGQIEHGPEQDQLVQILKHNIDEAKKAGVDWPELATMEKSLAARHWYESRISS